jgi:hypothetical protein
MTRANFNWAGLIILAIGAVVLLAALNVLPAGMIDILRRSWGALLIFIGLGLLLHKRFTLGSIAALVLTLLVVGAVAAVSYSSRAGQQRNDQVLPISETLDSGVSLLQVDVTALTTDIEIGLSEDDRTVSGEFIGSDQSDLTTEYVEDGRGLGAYTFTETKPNELPSLDEIGRGTLRLQVPADVPMDVVVRGQSGNMTLNLGGTALERLNLELANGNALITMPEYEPRSQAALEQPGTLTVNNGAITLVIPASVAGRFQLDRGSSGIAPQFDETIYQNIGGVLLENRQFNSADLVIEYFIVAPRGLIRIETTP